MPVISPTTLPDLLTRARNLAGCTVGEIAAMHDFPIPARLSHAKGWMGQLMEVALGAEAGNLPAPDFPHLGVELKTIPINKQGKPKESTYICVVDLTGNDNVWEHSLLWRKLQRILWVPILAEPELTLAERQIGMPFLWQPNATEIAVLRNDWEELMTLIHLGRVSEITAKQGTYLQIRPKAAHHRVVTMSLDDEGRFTSTLPRGFYLRPSFTEGLIAAFFGRSAPVMT